MADEDFPGNDIAIRQMWYRMTEIKAKQDLTNGRLTKLERFMWTTVGGLGVLTIVVTPLVIRLLAGA